MFDISNVISTFDRHSSNWDNKKHYISHKNGETRRLNKLLLELIRPGMSILDIGAGTGKIVRFISELKYAVNVFAIDISLNMLLEAKNFSSGGTEYFLSDIQNICFADNQFDLITLQQVIHHIPQPDLALNELYRILKPDGFVVLLTVGMQYQANLFPNLGADMLTDVLGRTNSYYLRQALVNNHFNVITTVDDYFNLIFNNFKNYFNFLESIGSLNKIFRYISPSCEDKNAIYQTLLQMVGGAKEPITVDGHYITALAKK